MSSWFGSSMGDPRSGTKTPQGQVQDYQQIRDYCLRHQILFEDPIFSPHVAGSSAKRSDCEWLRPHQISENPKFISQGISRFDVIQGELGDCWLIASMANLSLNQKLFSRVVPSDQSFDANQYGGVFHFRFWQYGKWVDIVIDDRLPTMDGKLLFVKSNDPDEFWSPLLEKAYAKLHGSFQALRGGTISESLVDFTGGLTEYFELQTSDCPANLFEIFLKAFERHSLIGCSIEAQDESQMENELPNGLIKGHAYSITSVINLDYQGRKVPLLRLRNPWSGTNEWNGAWSDSSHEWSRLSDYEKQRLGLTFEADGEFWMSFSDFKRNFTRVELCNLGPDAIEDEKQRSWYAQMFEGEWVASISAGGCRNNLSTFHLNPQYVFTLTKHDEGDGENLCTCIIALMQKHKRSKYTMGSDQLTIGFSIYYLDPRGVYQRDPVGYSAPQYKRQLLTTEFFKYNCSVARSPTYINLREISARFRLKPGTYCVIPSTYEPNEEGQFILRIWTESPASEVHENDNIPGLYPVPRPSPTPAPVPDEPRDRPKYPLPDEPKDRPRYPLPDEPKDRPKYPLPDEPKDRPRYPLPDEPKDRPKYPLPDEPKDRPKYPMPTPLPDEPKGKPTYPMPTPGVPSYPMPTPGVPYYPPYPSPTPSGPSYPSYPSYPTYPMPTPGGGASYPPYPQDPSGNGISYPPLPQEPEIRRARAPEPPPGPRLPIDINISEVISTVQTVINVLGLCWGTFQKMQASTDGRRNNRVFSENVGRSSGGGWTQNEAPTANKFFKKVAGPNLEVGPQELQQVLNGVFNKQQFKFNAEFSLETCKSLVATLDLDHSGRLGIVEFSRLWSNIQNWAHIFQQHDRNRSGSIDATELRDALFESGIIANRKLLSNMTKRYGNVEHERASSKANGDNAGNRVVSRSLSFDAFVHCCVKLRHMINTWNEKFANRSSKPLVRSVVVDDVIRSASNGKIPMIDDTRVDYDDLEGTEMAQFTLDEFITAVMYS